MGANGERRGLERRFAAASCAAGALALAAACFALMPRPARAEYDICNETSYVLRAAVAEKAGEDFHSAGWYIVYPGFCRPVIGKPLAQDTYYVHARTIDGHTGPMHDWGGDDKFCVAPDDFDIAGAGDCEQRGYASAYFSEVNVGSAKSWTTTFTEPDDLDLPKAQILGVQRLLMDLGYISENNMDGYLGHSTVNAIERFEQQAGLDLPQEPSIPLLTALVKQVEAKAKTRGLELCNQSKYAVWAAVGLPQDSSSVTTKGWFEIASGACVKPILDALSKSYIYVYGETVDAAEKKLYWHGDDRLCTNDVRFSITAKPDSCDDQGLIATDFEKVDTGGKPFWTYTFKDDQAADSPGG